MNKILDLSGNWEFAVGAQPDYRHSIQMPGSMQTQGFGDDIGVDTHWTGQIADRSWFTDERYAAYREPGNIKIPFFLQPDKHYVGEAWYRREICVPESWRGLRVVLFLERAHIRTTVYLDGVEIGFQDSLGAPHQHDLGCDIAPGPHLLTICVDNRLHIDVGPNSSSVTDHTQTNWNGIIGRLELRAGAPVWIEGAQVFPDVHQKSVRLEIEIGNATGCPGRGLLRVGSLRQEVEWDAQGGRAEMHVPLGADAKLWDEFSPALHELTLELGEAEKRISFGLREISKRGTQIIINGKPVFLRGTVECCVFPKTGYPPTDIAEWLRIFEILREYGFNHVRFHSWCPPEAAFVVADRLGFYLQIECSSWANTTTALGIGDSVDEWIYSEARAIIRAYGNHPSFLFMAYGNEPGEKPEDFTNYLARWVEHWKQAEPRRLHTGAAGWPALAANDFHNIPEPRIQVWGEGLRSRINARPPETIVDYRGFADPKFRAEAQERLNAVTSWNGVSIEEYRPIVSHEVGQWCAYPDFSEIPKYTGLLKAKNFEIFRDSLEHNHLGDLARDFLMASGRLQILCYKEEIESLLRTPGFGGFQILQANDFPGQGTALVGWLNPFWESKGYVTPQEFRRFNNHTVVLARLDKRVFSSDETVRASVGIAHFGEVSIQGAVAYWKFVGDDGVTYAEGEFPPRDIPIGNELELGEIEILLENLPVPKRFTLVVGLVGTDIENDWHLWVYQPDTPVQIVESLHVVHDWDEVLRLSRHGGKILFSPEASTIKAHSAIGFSSIFWNTSWTNGQAPHSLGIFCNPKHPLFASFPTEFHSNWQWWELIHGASAFLLDGLPPSLRPLVQIIDDWFTNRRLGLVFEARINASDLLVCGCDISSNLSDRHAARQFRESVFRYIAAEKFHPQVVISEREFWGEFVKNNRNDFQ